MGINVQTVLTVQTCLEECGPGNKDETGHWPLPDLGEKPHRGWGCMSGYVCVCVGDPERRSSGPRRILHSVLKGKMPRGHTYIQTF